MRISLFDIEDDVDRQPTRTLCALRQWQRHNVNKLLFNEIHSFWSHIHTSNSWLVPLLRIIQRWIFVNETDFSVLLVERCLLILSQTRTLTHTLSIIYSWITCIVLNEFLTEKKITERRCLRFLLLVGDRLAVCVLFFASFSDCRASSSLRFSLTFRLLPLLIVWHDICRRSRNGLCCRQQQNDDDEQTAHSKKSTKIGKREREKTKKNYRWKVCSSFGRVGSELQSDVWCTCKDNARRSIGRKGEWKSWNTTRVGINRDDDAFFNFTKINQLK